MILSCPDQHVWNWWLRQTQITKEEKLQSIHSWGGYSKFCIDAINAIMDTVSLEIAVLVADSKELARPFGSCNLTNISVFINGL